MHGALIALVLALAAPPSSEAAPAPGAASDSPPAVAPTNPPVSPAPPETAGWFAALEVASFGGGLMGQRAWPVGFFTAGPGVNAGGLDGPSGGRAALGYRLGEGRGEIALAYRGTGGSHQTVLVGDPVLAALIERWAEPGVSVVAGAPGPHGSAALTTRLEMNTIDLGYGMRHEEAPGPPWGLRWQAGARLATFFADDRLETGFASLQAANHYVGAGPFAAVDLSRPLTAPGARCEVALHAHAGGSALFGQARQTFRQGLPGEALVSRDRQGRVVPTMDAEAGLGFRLNGPAGPRLLVGYRFERWWGPGDVGGSRLDVTLHGLFLRWERDF